MAVADQILLDNRSGAPVACSVGGRDPESYLVLVYYDQYYSPGRPKALDTYFGDRCGR